MTNEEAQMTLANFKRYISGGGAIDRQANQAIDMAIKALGQPEQNWIPVTKALPKYGIPVLTWDGQCYFVEMRIPYIRDDNGDAIYSDWWVSDDYDDESGCYPNLRDGACVAWMPLPSPYQQ